MEENNNIAKTFVDHIYTILKNNVDIHGEVKAISLCIAIKEEDDSEYIATYGSNRGDKNIILNMLASNLNKITDY